VDNIIPDLEPCGHEAVRAERRARWLDGGKPRCILHFAPKLSSTIKVIQAPYERGIVRKSSAAYYRRIVVASGPDTSQHRIKLGSSSDIRCSCPNNRCSHLVAFKCQTSVVKVSGSDMTTAGHRGDSLVHASTNKPNCARPPHSSFTSGKSDFIVFRLSRLSAALI
jgi:hypothetical protein